MEEIRAANLAVLAARPDRGALREATIVRDTRVDAYIGARLDGPEQAARGSHELLRAAVRGCEHRDVCYCTVYGMRMAEIERDVAYLGMARDRMRRLLCAHTG